MPIGGRRSCWPTSMGAEQSKPAGPEKEMRKNEKYLLHFPSHCGSISSVAERRARFRVWRSLVSRLNGVQEASSSNLDTRTKTEQAVLLAPSFFVCPCIRGNSGSGTTTAAKAVSFKWGAAQIIPETALRAPPAAGSPPRDPRESAPAPSLPAAPAGGRAECTGAICPSALCLWPDGADNSPRPKRRPERGF